MSDTLKPCPFCGAQAKEEFAESISEHWIICGSERCDVEPAVVSHSQAVARNKWNSRPVEDAANSRAEAAEKALNYNLTIANKSSRFAQEERNKMILKLRQKYSAIEISSMIGLTRQRIHQILNEPTMAISNAIQNGMERRGEHSFNARAEAAVELENLRLAGISTAAIGYWKEGDSIHPDFDTVALRDVAKLYQKYVAADSRLCSVAEALRNARVVVAEMRVLNHAIYDALPSSLEEIDAALRDLEKIVAPKWTQEMLDQVEKDATMIHSKMRPLPIADEGVGQGASASAEPDGEGK